MLSIESEFHPFICGPNNSHLSSIQESTGVRISLPPFSSGKTDINISGEKEGVAQAAARVKQLYQAAVRNMTLLLLLLLLLSLSLEEELYYSIC